MGVVLLWAKPIVLVAHNWWRRVRSASLQTKVWRVSTTWIVGVIAAVTATMYLAVPQGELAGDGPGPIGVAGALLVVIVLSRRRLP